MKHVPWYLLAALVAGAASAEAPKRPNPIDAQAPVPAPVYRSAFDGYKPIGPEPRAIWREVNEEVGRMGGHIGILREQAARERRTGGERK